MSFSNPTALLFLGLAPLLLLFHLARRPGRIYSVSNLFLWQESASDTPSRRLLRRIENPWLLILQLLFLVVTVFALARPVISVTRQGGRDFVFIFDSSASMNTREDEGSRFEAARRLALEVVDDLRREDRLMLIEAKNEPRVVSDFISDTGELRRLIRDLSPKESVADIGGAVLFALSLGEEAENLEVYVFSDGAENATIPETLALENVKYVQVGENADNVAITKFGARRNLLSPHDQAAYVEVANFSDRRHRVRLSISLEGKNLEDESWILEPGERRSIAAEAPLRDPGVLRARIDVEDRLPVDNQAFAVLGSSDPIRVLLVSRGNFFLEKALEVNPRIAAFAVSPERYSPGEAEKYDVVILDGVGSENLVEGNYFVIQPPEASAPGAQILVNPAVTVADPRHPVVTLVDWSNVTVDRAAPVMTPLSSKTLLEARDKPLLAAYENEDLRLIVMGFDPRDSDLPLRVSFPILISNVIEWLSRRAGDDGIQLRVGDPLDRYIDPGRGLEEIAITTPRGDVFARALIGNRLTFRETDATGIYTMRGKHFLERFAVNLLDEAESNIRPVVRPDAEASPEAASVSLQMAEREITRYLLVAALVLLLAEWLYYCRTKRVFALK